MIDTKAGYVEHPGLIAQRLTSYAGVVGRERALAGTDCGLGTIVGTNWVSPRVVWVSPRRGSTPAAHGPPPRTAPTCT